MAKYIEMEGRVQIDLTALFNNILKPKKDEPKPQEEKKEDKDDE